MKKKKSCFLEAGFLASLTLAFYAFAGNAGAATTCEPEPTDMSVGYGEQIICEIDPDTDTDTFRFSGNAGDRILAEALWVSGNVIPYIELFAPDGADLGTGTRFDIVLPQTGTYTVSIHDSIFNRTGEYAFTVSCTGGSCLPLPPPPPPPGGGNIGCEPEPTDMFAQYGQRVTCDITPDEDTDLYRFPGNAGDRILAEALWVSGSISTTLVLRAPDGSPVDTGYHRIVADLPETGIYTVLVHDTGFIHTGEYAFTVSCTGGSCLPLPGLPTLTLSLTGCTACQAADQFTVQAHLTNPGSSDVLVEAKIGLRLPDGTAINTLGDRHLEVPLAAGYDLPFLLFDFPLPGGLPAGSWTVEGTLLGPDLGETFSREVKPFEVLP